MGFYSDQEQRQIIADNIKHFLSITGKEQKATAIELDVNPPTFNQWIQGRATPPVSMLKKIAGYFNVPLSSIVDPPGSADRVNIEVLTELERSIVTKFRESDEITQHAVLRILGVN